MRPGGAAALGWRARAARRQARWRAVLGPPLPPLPPPPPPPVGRRPPPRTPSHASSLESSWRPAEGWDWAGDEGVGVSVGGYATLKCPARHSSQLDSSVVPRRTRRVVAVRLLARGVGALRGTLTGDGDLDRRRAGLAFGDFVERVGIDPSNVFTHRNLHADTTYSVWNIQPPH